MKLLLKTIFVALTLISLPIIMLVAIDYGKFNKPLKYAIEYVLQNNGYDVKISKLKFSRGELTLRGVDINYFDNKHNIINAHLEQINGNVTTTYEKSANILKYINLDLDINNLKIERASNVENIDKANVHDHIIAATGSLNLSFNLFNKEKNLTLYLHNINNKEKQFAKTLKFKINEIAAKDDINQENCDYEFEVDFNIQNQQDFKSYLNICHNDASAIINVEQIEVSDLMNLLEITPEALIIKPLEFWIDSVKKAYIEKALLKIVYNRNFDEQSTAAEAEKFDMNGRGEVKDIIFKYHKDLPVANISRLEGVVINNKVDIKLFNVEAAKIDFTNFYVSLNITDLEKDIVYLRGSTTGSSKNLAKFIPLNINNRLIKNNIDFSALDGIVNLDVKIDVPLSKNIANYYDISAKLNNNSLSIFNDKVKLSDANLNGQFKGDNLFIEGDGQINGYDSLISFAIDTSNKGANDHRLSIVTDIKKKRKGAKNSEKLYFLSFMGGETKLNFDYFSTNDRRYFEIVSDLTNLSLFVDKLGIEKSAQHKAFFSASGEITDDDKCELNIDIKGDNNLEARGNLTLNANNMHLKMPTFKHNDTNLYIDLSNIENKTVVSIRGNKLDLRKSDMLQFLEKERDENNAHTDIEVMIEDILLKDDLNFNKFELAIKCDELRCYSGKASASLADQKITLNIQAPEDEHEVWLLKADDAGELLRAFGAYSNMQDGKLDIKLKLSRKEADIGQNIPICSGDFIVTDFHLTKTPILSKIVSYASIAGFVNIFNKKNKISFKQMDGKFSFIDNILKIDQGAALGPYFDFSIQGNIDLNQRDINLKGKVTPSLYGINVAVKNIPVIGKIVTGNNKSHGIISAPYSIIDKF